MKKRHVAERLLSNFKVDSKGCWIWQGSKHEKGYPLIEYNNKTVRGHRLVYELMSGEPIPAGLMCIHECDEPACINYSHLRVGTNQDNMDDRSKRGRTANGERAGGSKLSYMMVEFIRYRDDSNAECAIIYGVSRKTIADIRNRKTWKHVKS